MLFWLASVTLYASYTATLTSHLAVKTEHMPFSSMREALAKGWIVAICKGTWEEDMLKVIYPTVDYLLFSGMEICQLEVWNDCIYDFISPYTLL